MRVYLMGPIAKGDWMMNLRQVLDAAEEVFNAGHHPFLPHLDMFWHLVYPHTPNEWLKWDFEWLSVCGAAIRLPGESPGSDKETEKCEDWGIPVFMSVAEFLAWCENRREYNNGGGE